MEKIHHVNHFALHYVVWFHLWMSIIHPLWIMFIYQFSFSCLSSIYHIFWFPSFFSREVFKVFPLTFWPPYLSINELVLGSYSNTFTNLSLNGTCIYQHVTNFFCYVSVCFNVNQQLITWLKYNFILRKPIKLWNMFWKDPLSPNGIAFHCIWLTMFLDETTPTCFVVD